VVLRRPEGGAEGAAVLERIGHVAQVGLGGVVHQRGEGVLGIAAALLDQLGHVHRVLSDRIEDAAVAAEPALVGGCPGDVTGVELRWVKIERVHPATRDGLQVRAGSGRGGVGHRHTSHGMELP
jgi:hypothetical protein